MSITKSQYIVILLLIGLKFFDLKLFGSLFEIDWFYTAIMLFILAYGYFTWGRDNFVLIGGDIKYWIWMMIGVCISFIPLFLHNGQNPLWSAWIYRDMLVAYCAIPIVLSICPLRSEVYRALNIFAIIYAIVYITAGFMPSLLVDRISGADGRVVGVLEGDFGRLLSGYPLLLFPLFEEIKEYTNYKNRNNLLYIIIIILFLLLIQSRSILFPALILTTIALWKYSDPLFKIVLICPLLYFLFEPSSIPIYGLIEETQTQLADSDYNRNLALAYYFKDNFANIEQILCGHGVISAHLSSQVNDIQELALSGIHLSDVGFLGFMNTYGIITVITTIVFLISILLNYKQFSIAVTFTAISILVCSLTISYFQQFNTVCWLMILYLLYFIEKNQIDLYEDE